MEMIVDTLEEGITRITLAGRMDYAAATEIDASLLKVARRDKFLLVDLSKTIFLASMGIRTLLTTAKAAKDHGGKMVLFQPELEVAKVLKASGTDTLVPVYYDLKLAQIALQNP